MQATFAATAFASGSPAQSPSSSPALSPRRQRQRKSIEPSLSAHVRPEDRAEELLRRELLAQRDSNKRYRGTRVAADKLKERTDRLRHFQYRCGHRGEAVKEFNVLKAATEPFGYHHGQRIYMTSGKLRGRGATIIGVSDGWLWRHQDGDRGATAFNGHSKEEIEERYGIVAECRGGDGQAIMTPQQKRDHLRGLAALPCRGQGKAKRTGEAPFCQYRTAEAVAAALLAAWEDKYGDVVDELAQNLRTPESDPIQVLAEVGDCALRRAPPEALEAGAELAPVGELGEACALVILLWTQEQQDTDRLLLWDDVPPPRLVAANDETEDAQELARSQYRERHAGDLSDRNVCLSAQLGKVGRVFMQQSWFQGLGGGEQQARRPAGARRQSALPSTHFRQWPKVLSVLCAAAARAPPQVLARTFLRVVEPLPVPVLEMYAKLEPGKRICWPSPCSAIVVSSVEEVPDSPVHGLRGTLRCILTEAKGALCIAPISQYPDEGEVLIPPLSCWEVLHSVCREGNVTVTLKGVPPPEPVAELCDGAAEEAAEASERLRQQLKQPRRQSEAMHVLHHGRLVFVPVKEHAAKESEEEEKQATTLVRQLLIGFSRRDARMALVDPSMREIRAPFICWIPGSGAVALDSHPSVLGPFGVAHGQRFQFQGDSYRRGVLTTILGFGCGRVWHHPDNGDPRPFVQTTGRALHKHHQLCALGWDQVPEYPTTKVSYAGMDYSVSERHVDNFGVFHGQRVIHTRGEHAGRHGLVLGCRGDDLFQILDGSARAVTMPSGCCSADDLELLCGLQHRGAINYTLLAPDPEIGRVRYSTEDGQLLLFDVRCSSCMQHGAVHGQEVKIVQGDHVGRCAVVVGVAQGALWAVFVTPRPVVPGVAVREPKECPPLGAAALGSGSSWDSTEASVVAPMSGTFSRRQVGVQRRAPRRGCHRADRPPPGEGLRPSIRLADGCFVVLKKPAVQLCSAVTQLDRHPRRMGTRYATAENEASTARLREVSFCPVQALACFGEILTFDASYATCNVFRLYHRQRVCWRPLGGAQEVHSTVVGVWMAELWRIDDGELVARPWAGSSAEELVHAYEFTVVGIGAPVRLPHDPLLPRSAQVLGSVLGPEYRREGVIEHATDAGHVLGFVTSTEAIQEVCPSIPGLCHGFRLEKVRRAERPQMMTSPARRRGQPEGTPRRLWNWFKAPAKCSVVGAHGGDLWVHFDGHPGAEPLDRADLRFFRPSQEPVRALQPHLAPALTDLPRQQRWEQAGAGAEADADAEERAAGEDDSREDGDEGGGEGGDLSRYPFRPITRVEERRVLQHLCRVTQRDEDEMRFRFWRTPGDSLVPVLRWILELHGAEPQGGASAGMLLRMLCVLESEFDQPIQPPPLADWMAARLRKLVRVERSSRAALGLQWEASQGRLGDELRIVVLLCDRIRREQQREQQRRRSKLQRKSVLGSAASPGRARSSVHRVLDKSGTTLSSDNIQSRPSSPKQAAADHGAASRSPGSAWEGDEESSSLTLSSCQSFATTPEHCSPAVAAQDGRSSKSGSRFSETRASAAVECSPQLDTSAAAAAALLSPKAAHDANAAADAEAGAAAAAENAGGAGLTPSMLRIIRGAAASFRGARPGLRESPAATLLGAAVGKALQAPMLRLPEMRQEGDREVTPLRYVLRTGAVIRLDISNRACARFGLFSGQKVTYTAGDLDGRNVIVVGVCGNRLWRFELGHPKRPAAIGLLPYRGTSAQEIQGLHQMTVHPTDVPIPKSDPFEFLTHQGKPTIFDPSDDACLAFGVRHGDRYVTSLEGTPLTGQVLAIIGVHADQLWYAVDWSGAVAWTPTAEGQTFPQAMSLKLLYHATVSPWTAEAPVLVTEGRCFDVSAAAVQRFGACAGQRMHSADRNYGGIVLGVRFGHLCYSMRGDRAVYAFDHVDAVQRCKLRLGPVPQKPPQGDHIESKLPATEPGRSAEFRFMGTGQRVCLFDTREASTKAFGYRHGQRLKLTPSSKAVVGCMVTVIGVRDKLLWRVVDGEEHATAFIGARSAELIKQLWDPVELGMGKVQEMTG